MYDKLLFNKEKKVLELVNGCVLREIKKLHTQLLEMIGFRLVATPLLNSVSRCVLILT